MPVPSKKLSREAGRLRGYLRLFERQARALGLEETALLIGCAETAAADAVPGSRSEIRPARRRNANAAFAATLAGGGGGGGSS